jgi:mono/diheme cytochrome c family protein
VWRLIGCGVVAALLAGTAVATDEQLLFATNCAVCHQHDGSGIAGLAPPLKSGVWQRLDGRAGTYLAGVMLSGLVGVPLDGQHYTAAMPPWAHLSDADLAAIGSFVLEKLNGAKKGLDAAIVAAARASNRDHAALKELRAEEGVLGVEAATSEVGARDKYVLFCAGCHGIEGEGGGGGGGMKRIFPFPPAIGVFLNDPKGRLYLANVGGVTSAGMSDAETAEVLNYILLSFGQSSTPQTFVPYTPDEIRGLRENRVDDPLALRREIGARLRQAGLQLPPYEWD